MMPKATILKASILNSYKAHWHHFEKEGTPFFTRSLAFSLFVLSCNEFKCSMEVFFSFC